MQLNAIKKITPVKLEMVRGDNKTISVTIKNYEFNEGDKIEFTVRSTASDSEKVIYKSIDATEDGIFVISLAPSDTSSLEFGMYVYDIQLTINGNIRTIVPCSRFRILEEVTYDG